MPTLLLLWRLKQTTPMMMMMITSFSLMILVVFQFVCAFSNVYLQWFLVNTSLRGEKSPMLLWCTCGEPFIRYLNSVELEIVVEIWHGMWLKREEEQPNLSKCYRSFIEKVDANQHLKQYFQIILIWWRTTNIKDEHSSTLLVVQTNQTDECSRFSRKCGEWKVNIWKPVYGAPNALKRMKFVRKPIWIWFWNVDLFTIVRRFDIMLIAISDFNDEIRQHP